MQKVAFEVDDVDDFLEAGWCVLVRAGALLTDDQLELLESNAPDPKAHGRPSARHRLRAGSGQASQACNRVKAVEC
jgi:hypothetical protein